MRNIVLILLLFSISSLNFAQMDNFNWLLCEWKMESENSYIVENWAKVGFNTIEGESFTFDSQTDSILFSESLRILHMGNEYFYLAKVPQNHMPIAFLMTYIDENSIIFENGSHDYPQRIEYSKLENDSLVVTISLIDKEKSKRKFHYKKR